MKRNIIALFIALFFLAVFSAGLVAAQNIIRIDPAKYNRLPGFLGYRANEFIIVLKDDVGVNHAQDMLSDVALNHLSGFENLARQFGVTRLRPQFVGADTGPRRLTPEGRALARHYKIRISKGMLDDAVTEYAKLPFIDRVEKIGIHTVYATPNDFYYGYQWHLNQTSDHDIDAPEGWDIETGDVAIIVALLDSGVRYYHPDLGGVNASLDTPEASRGNMWINNAELNGSQGVDDDDNGYVDDWIGYDFIESTSRCWPGEDCGTQDNDPRDFNGHGTHTAGIFGMITNDGYGMCGVAGGWGDGSQTEYGNGVKIMALRMGFSYNWFGQEVGVVYMDAAAEAFYYAADNGAKIASCSWGSSNSGGIAAAADYFLSSGGIICVAAGNDEAEVLTPDYLNGRGDCISVAATNENDNGASFTTYGTWVDICAPGDNIYSTYHNHTDPGTNYWAEMGGTSMATPMTAGVAALIWSQNPTWTASLVEERLYSSADNIDAYLSPKYIGKMGAGRINAYNAVVGACDVLADFSGTPVSGCAPLTVDFTDLSTGTGIDGWAWDFGDEVGTSTAQNPSYTYNSSGTYTVTLIASSSSQGCNDTETKTGYITVNGGPIANFVSDITNGTEPLTVNFTDTSTGDPVTWAWDFGDGVGTSTERNPGYTYTSAGTYTVTLTVSNACGSDEELKTDYITVDPCIAPVADFSGTPVSGCAPLTVDFTDQSTGSPTSWSWDFGDGVGTSTEQNPRYTYTSAGTYTVTLTVSNACGSDEEPKTDYITVDPCVAPVADFSGTPVSGCAPLTVDFTDQSTGSPTSWAWDFGDGGMSSDQNPSYTYNEPGSYTVKLTASNGCGSDDEIKIDYIDVTPCGPDRAYANAEIQVIGTVTGDLNNTTASDNVYEYIKEIEYTNHPKKRSSYLEHKWTFDVGSGGSNMQFNVEASRPDNQDNDDFVFEYSTDDTVYNPMVTVASSDEQVYSVSLPALTGTIYVRVIDTDLTWGNISLDTVSIDEMYIEYETSPGLPVAIFVGDPISGQAPLTVNFTDQSTGSPTSWDWAFGDGIGTSSDQNPSYEYSESGTYTVRLTVTNEYGSDTEEKVNYITVNSVGSSYSHVNDITVGRRKTGVNYRGTCTATIYDQDNGPLANATVSVWFDGPNSGSLSGITASDGTVYFEGGPIKNPVGEWCFEVTDVIHATHDYDSDSNLVTRTCESGPVY